MAREGTTERWQDVREAGLATRVGLDVARARLRALLPATARERVSLAAATGRVTAEPALALRDVPSSPRARVDGFALRAAATFGAGAYNPLVLTAGFSRIAAGEGMPPATDAVLPFVAATPSAGCIEVTEPVAPGDGVEPRGAAWQRDDAVLSHGRRLSAWDIACAAAAGLRELAVVRRPRILLVAPGPKSGEEPGEAMYAALAFLIARDGGTLATRAANATLSDAPGCADLVLVHGRTGCGADDDAAPTLAALGEVAVHGVALAPGGSAGLGRLGRVPVVLLPGQPVACFAAYELLAGPAVRRLAGLPEALPHPRRRSRLAAKIASQVGTSELWLVRAQDDAVVPLGPPDLATLGSVAQACGFVLVQPNSEGLDAGSEVEVHLLEPNNG